MAKYIKTTNLDRDVLAFLLTEPHKRIRVNTFNVSRELDVSGSGVSKSFRNLKTDGLIMRSFTGSYYITKGKEDLVKKILAKGLKKFKIED